MAGNGYNRLATRNARIYATWLASQEAARLLGERIKTYNEIARLFAAGGHVLTRARIGQIIADERRRASLPVKAV